MEGLGSSAPLSPIIINSSKRGFCRLEVWEGDDGEPRGSLGTSATCQAFPWDTTARLVLHLN